MSVKEVIAALQDEYCEYGARIAMLGMSIATLTAELSAYNAALKDTESAIKYLTRYDSVATNERTYADMLTDSLGKRTRRGLEASVVAVYEKTGCLPVNLGAIIANSERLKLTPSFSGEAILSLVDPSEKSADAKAVSKPPEDDTSTDGNEDPFVVGDSEEE